MDSEERGTDEQSEEEKPGVVRRLLGLFATAILQTLKSPGFIAMALGFVTACIPPLRNALFEPGGALRFIGSSLESLGLASASVGVMVVAASLVDRGDSAQKDDGRGPRGDAHGETEPGPTPAEGGVRRRAPGLAPAREVDEARTPKHDLRAYLREGRPSTSQLSARALRALRRRHPTFRTHAWFVASRLAATPAVVCLLVVAGDCGGALDGVPALAKLVVAVNASLPGAQLIVLTLKAQGLSDSAAGVARVYLPSYLLSVVTVAAWTSVGLMISVPREDGTSFCGR